MGTCDQGQFLVHRYGVDDPDRLVGGHQFQDLGLVQLPHAFSDLYCRNWDLLEHWSWVPGLSQDDWKFSTDQVPNTFLGSNPL